MQGDILADVEGFLRQIQALTIEDFQVIRKFNRLHFETRDSSRSLLRLGAADFSWLEKRSREVVRNPITDPACPTSLGSGLTTYVQGAAQAIIRRDRLSLEQYESCVGGFRLVGVVIPDHPSTAVEGSHV